MANKLLWTAETVATLLSTELNNVADGSLTIDAADYVNATNLFRLANFQFFGTFDAATDANGFAELHIFYKIDGNYGDGEDGDVGAPVATGNSLHGIFQINAVADIYINSGKIEIEPFDFRAGIKLATGQDLTAVDTHFLKVGPFNENLQ